MSDTLSDRLYEADCRIDKIVHLETMVVDDIDDDLFEWMTDGIEHVLRVALEIDNFDEMLNQYGADHHSQVEALREAILHKPLTGWLVQASTPVKKFHENGYGFSWGHTKACTFYAEQYADALEAAIAWAEAGQNQ